MSLCQLSPSFSTKTLQRVIIKFENVMASRVINIIKVADAGGETR